MADRILVIDDDKMNRLMAKKTLEERYKVDCAASEEEAREYLKHQIPDLILLNSDMPNIDGMEVYKELQSDEKIKDVPIIFLTTDGVQEHESELFKAGDTNYIRKPFCAEVAERQIEHVLELHRLHRSLQNEMDKKASRECGSKVKKISIQNLMKMRESDIDFRMCEPEEEEG